MQSINPYIKAILLSIFTTYCYEISFAQTPQTPPIQQSDIPLIIIERGDEAIPDLNKIQAQMKVVDNATGLNDFDGPYVYDESVGIETRGASSLIYPKQSFSVETRDADGNNLNTKLLGFPLENDWIFDGPYDDKTFMRNHLAYDLARDMGWYAPRAKFFNLIIDTLEYNYYTNVFENLYKYKGVYVLLERIKRDDDRVDISLLRPDEIDLPNTLNGFPDVTGGYIIKVDESSGSNFEGWFSSNGSFTWNYVYTYPKADEIVLQQTNYIQNFIANFEMVMDGNNYADPVNGYPTIINEESFMDFIILQEVSKNIDGYRKSSYLHKTKNSKDSLLFAGPIWDFNLAFGNAVNFNGNATTGFQYQFNQQFSDNQFPVPFYWEKLMNDTEFAAQVACRYNQHRAEALSNENILGKIDSMANVLQTAQQLNYEQYDVLGSIVSNETPATYNSYQEAVDDLKNWLTERLAFLDSQWAGESFDVKSTSGNYSVCPDTPVTLSVEGSLTSLYDWQPNTYIAGSTTGASVQVVADSTITYIVSGFNNLGCVDTAEIKITIDGFASTTGGPNKRRCPGEVDTLEASGAISYRWEPTTGLSNPNIANPLATPDTTTTYKVTMISQEQCEVFDFVKVTVKEVPPLEVSEDVSICESTNVNLMATSDAFSTYMWTAEPPDPSLSGNNNIVPNPIVQPTETTTYTIIVTGENNCTNSDFINVSVVIDGALEYGADATICQGESVELECPSVDNLLSVNWLPVSGLDDPTTLCPQLNPTETTTYTISAQTMDGCAYSGSFTVNVLDGQAVYAGEDRSYCEGEDLQLNATGGGTDFVWSPSTGLSNPNIANPTVSITETTTYTIKNSGDNVCESSDEITIQFVPNTIDAGMDVSFCKEGDGIQLNASGGDNYSWSPSAGLSNSNIANPFASPNQSTTYIASSSQNNCVFKDEVVVTVNELADFNTGEDLIICDGASGNLEATGGVSYQWSPDVALSDANIASPVVDANRLNQSLVTYSVLITDENGCTATARQNVIINEGSNITVSNDVSICPNGQTTLNASGGLTYLWSPETDLSGNTIIDDVNSNNPIVSPSDTQTFTVEINDENGCKIIKEVTVSVANNLVVDAGNDVSICTGESFQLNASGGTQYSWSPSTGLDNINTASVLASPSETTTYTVTVSDGANCSATDEVTITVNEKPIASLTGDNNICEGTPAELYASGGNNYSWSSDNPNENLPSENTIIVNPLVSTTYTVLVSNQNNCTSEESLTIQVNPIPQVDAGDIEAFCEGTSVRLTVNTNALNARYNWSPATGLSAADIQNPVASPATNTTYTVVVNDENNCTAQDDVLVVVNILPVVSILQSSEVTCDGNSVQLEATGGQNYSWSPTTGLNNANIPNPTASPAENTNYTVTATDENGCSATSSIDVNVGGGLSTGISEGVTICRGESTQLQATGGAVYEWTPATGLSATDIANPTASPGNSLTYTVEISDAKGDCSAFETVQVTVNNIPSAFAGPDLTICSGDEAMLQAAGGSNFSWSPTEGLSDTSIANPVVNVTGNQTYVVTVSDNNGCSASDEVNIIVQAKPVAFAGNDTSVCKSAIINLSGSGVGETGTYLWSPADIVSNANDQNIQVNVSETTTLILTVTDENECMATDEVMITVAPEPDINTSGDLSICEGGSANLFAEGGTIYQWSPVDFLDDPNLPNPISTPMGVTSVEYTVAVSNEFGCSDTKKVVVSIDDEIDADAGNNEIICKGESIQLNAAGGVSYNWSPLTDGNNVSIIDNALIASPTVTPTETTTFTVMVSDGSCEGNDDVTITVIDDLSVSINGNTNLNEGESTSLEAEGADTYSWSPNDGTLSCVDCASPTATPLNTTTYTVTGSQGNCSGMATITVVINACELNTTISEAVSLCDESTVQLNASGGTTYQWSPDDGSLSCLDCPNPIASPDESTLYTVVISNDNCEASETVQVTIGSSKTIFTNQEENICFGEVLTYDLSDLFSYSIIPQNGLSIENETATFQPNTSTAYSLEGTFESGCMVNDMLQINIIETQVIESKNYEICSGASVTLNEGFMLDGEVQWNPVNGLNDTGSANPIAKPSQTTEYLLSYIDENNCKSEATFTVNVTPVSFASVNEDIVICAGGQAQLQAFGGASYSWSPTTNLANSNSFNPIASPITTSVYTVTVEDENGCVDEKDVTVFVEDELNVTLTDSVSICMDGQGVRLEPNGAFVYIWNPSEGLSDNQVANPIANPNVSTTYTLNASDGACTATKDVYIEVINESLTVDAGSDKMICEGGSIQLQANSEQADAYRWEPRTGLSDHLSANPIASPTKSTVYLVEAIIVDRNSHNNILCTNFDEVTVFVEAPLQQIDVPETQTICEGTSVELIAEALPNLMYSWSPANSLNDANIANPIASPMESTTYQLEVSSVGGCVNTYEVQVNVNTLDNATAGKDVLICWGDIIQLQAGGAIDYVWDDDPELYETTIRNPYVQPTESNIYYVTLSIGDCSKRDSVFVEVIDFENTTEVITVCENGATTLQATGGNNYFWTSTLPIANPTQASQFIQPNSATQYEVEINTGNCSYTKIFDVQIGDVAEVTLPSSYQSCLDSEIELLLSGDNLSNIEWMPADGLSNTNTANPNLTITEEALYDVSFTVNNSCISQLSTQIHIIDSIKISLNGSFFAICEGDDQNLMASGGSNYSWSPASGLNQTIGDSVIASPQETTTYTVSSMDADNGCSGSEQVTIIVNSFEEDAGAIDDFESCEGDAIQLQVSGGTNYQWQPADLLNDPTSAEPTVANPSDLSETQIFTVRISESECVLEDSVTVSIKECLVEFVPSAFSPNNDGINDHWVIEGIHRFPENQVNVYNRWGQLVYSSRNYQNNWQGDFKGVALPEATYYYTLALEGENELRKGTVSIIR